MGTPGGEVIVPPFPKTETATFGFVIKVVEFPKRVTTVDKTFVTGTFVLVIIVVELPKRVRGVEMALVTGEPATVVTGDAGGCIQPQRSIGDINTNKAMNNL
jgi:hypothetical protein